MLIINIDGNIGAGKTTLVDYLVSKLSEELQKRRESFEIFIIKEDVDRDDEIRDLLKNYYEDPPSYALKFQKWIINDKYQQLIKIFERIESNKENQKKTLIIFDRSLDADYEVFCKLQYKLGNITEKEFENYKIFFDGIKKKFLETLNLYKSNCFDIYLETSIINCIKRIEIRSRDGENKINEEYLKYLNEEHINLYKNKKNSIQIDGNNSINKVKYDLNNIILKYFLN
jgi:deoxyadenosine/deoxycytidine kinase